MPDLENDFWIILDPSGNMCDIYANLAVIAFLNLNCFWITQVGLRLKGTFLKASFIFVTIF